VLVCRTVPPGHARDLSGPRGAASPDGNDRGPSRCGADDHDAIVARLLHYADRDRLDLVVTSGGTAWARTDPRPRGDPGAGSPRCELLRRKPTDTTPRSVLSRGVAGPGKDLIRESPRKPGGVLETLTVFSSAPPPRGAPGARRPLGPSVPRRRRLRLRPKNRVAVTTAIGQTAHSLEDARARCSRHPPLPSREVALDQALGLAVAEPVRARGHAPFDNSAVDGFAVGPPDVGPASPQAPARSPRGLPGRGVGGSTPGAIRRGRASHDRSPVPECVMRSSCWKDTMPGISGRNRATAAATPPGSPALGGDPAPAGTGITCACAGERWPRGGRARTRAVSAGRIGL